MRECVTHALSLGWRGKRQMQVTHVLTLLCCLVVIGGAVGGLVWIGTRGDSKRLSKTVMRRSLYTGPARVVILNHDMGLTADIWVKKLGPLHGWGRNFMAEISARCGMRRMRRTWSPSRSVRCATPAWLPRSDGRRPGPQPTSSAPARSKASTRSHFSQRNNINPLQLA